MKTSVKIPRLGYAVLGLIVQAPMSGYDVRRQFTSTPMGHYSDSPGAIYPALSRLERDGCIVGRVEDTQSLRPRKLYRPTPIGKAALAAWIREAPTPQDIVDNTADWLLRLAFATGVLSNGEAAALLRAIEAACTTYARELETHAAVMPKDARFPRFALDHGVSAYQATAAWAANCIAKLPRDARK
jgi:DNA-binding PadR family transcriptional regulator